MKRFLRTTAIVLVFIYYFSAIVIDSYNPIDWSIIELIFVALLMIISVFVSYITTTFYDLFK